MQIVLAVHNKLQFSVCRHVGYVGQSSRHGDRLLKEQHTQLSGERVLTISLTAFFVSLVSRPYVI